jgi:hypothetical protein
MSEPPSERIVKLAPGAVVRPKNQRSDAKSTLTSPGAWAMSFTVAIWGWSTGFGVRQHTW